tara:strand:+ start:179 stop:460 length:282 start_codon:yes stop_codon:yes gene_type:complete
MENFESYQLKDGTIVYLINGVKVSKEEYIKQRIIARKKLKEFSDQGKQEAESFSKDKESIEEKRERIKKKFKKLKQTKNYARGGGVRPAKYKV